MALTRAFANLPKQGKTSKCINLNNAQTGNETVSSSCPFYSIARMKSECIEGEQLQKIPMLSYACLSIRALGGTLELVTNCAISEEWGTSSKDKRNFLCLK